MATQTNISLRVLAKQLGVSQPFLSQIRGGKRPMPEGLKKQLEAMGAYHLLIGDKQDEKKNCCQSIPVDRIGA